MEWISVKDRLPEIKAHGFSEFVLASTGNIQIDIVRYDHDYNKWIPKHLKFTHWMPLPEPPKPQELMTALHKKFLKIIDSDEPVYCNESLAKSLEKIANDQHKEASKELLQDLESKIRNCNNDTSIFNTLDYVLFEDVKKALENHLK